MSAWTAQRRALDTVRSWVASKGMGLEDRTVTNTLDRICLLYSTPTRRLVTGDPYGLGALYSETRLPTKVTSTLLPQQKVYAMDFIKANETDWRAAQVLLFPILSGTEAGAFDAAHNIADGYSHWSLLVRIENGSWRHYDSTVWSLK